MQTGMFVNKRVVITEKKEDYIVIQFPSNEKWIVYNSFGAVGDTIIINFFITDTTENYNESKIFSF